MKKSNLISRLLYDLIGFTGNSVVAAIFGPTSCIVFNSIKTCRLY